MRSRSVTCVPVVAGTRIGPLARAAVDLSAGSILPGDQVDEFVGQAQVQGVGDIRVATGIGASELVGAGARVGDLVGDGIGGAVAGVTPASVRASVDDTATFLSGDGVGHVPQE